MWSAFGVCVNGSSQRWRENKSDPVHCVLGRSACLFGFLSLDHVLFFFEKGTAHADVVNYKAGLVRRACQFVCERVFAPHSVSSCLNVSMWVCSCVLGLSDKPGHPLSSANTRLLAHQSFSDLHTVLPALGKQNRVQIQHCLIHKYDSTRRWRGPLNAIYRAMAWR